MGKKFYFNAFEMNSAGHLSAGLWAHPRDRSWQYKDLEYWTDLAKTAEKGFFTAIFIADVIGYYDVYKNSARTVIEQGIQIPINDPLQVAGPIAQATQHIGIGITSSTSFEHPYTFARRIATADHYTKGRVGWNIVTSYLKSGANNISKDNLDEHDNRYEIADEYLEVIYKLLEGSWEDDAVVRDKEKRIFAHPDKVHDIAHKGKYFEVPGIGLTEPSPQRTPVLFQAGSSDAGKTFSAKHAECKFISGPSSKIIKEYVSDTRQRTAKAGRDPKNILIFALATIIVDESDEKAQAKYEDYKKYISYDGTLALVSGWSGIDFGLYEATDTVEKAKKPESNAMLSLVERYTDGEEKDWSIKKLVEWNGIGGGGPVFIGSPITVADQLQEWVEETDIDGFNIGYAVSQEHIEDIVKYLVPELQKRGVYPTSYTEGTLRDKLFGHSKLPNDHPAARYRDIEKVKREEAKKI